MILTLPKRPYSPAWRLVAVFPVAVQVSGELRLLPILELSDGEVGTTARPSEVGTVFRDGSPLLYDFWSLSPEEQLVALLRTSGKVLEISEEEYRTETEAFRRLRKEVKNGD